MSTLSISLCLITVTLFIGSICILYVTYKWLGDMKRIFHAPVYYRTNYGHRILEYSVDNKIWTKVCKCIELDDGSLRYVYINNENDVEDYMNSHQTLQSIHNDQVEQLDKYIAYVRKYIEEQS